MRRPALHLSIRAPPRLHREAVAGPGGTGATPPGPGHVGASPWTSPIFGSDTSGWPQLGYTAGFESGRPTNYPAYGAPRGLLPPIPWLEIEVVFTRPVHPGSRRQSPRAAFAGKPAPPLPTAARPTQTRGRSLLIFPSPSPPRPQPPRRPGFPGPTTTWPKAARALPAPPPCPPTAFISNIFALQVRS